MSDASGDRATHSKQPEFTDIDAQIKLAELEIRKAEAAKIKAEIGRGINWNIVGPLLVGIVAAVPPTYGVWQNGIAQTKNARAQTDNEVLKARTTLFIEAVKSGSQEPEQRKERVKFFLNTGLLSDPDGKIAKAVEEGKLPALAAPHIEFKIYDNWNIGGVTQRPDGPLQPTTFTIFDNLIITSIATYHWNEGNGKPGGQIILKRQGGAEIARCSVVVSSGQNNRPNVNWVCPLNIQISAGTYEIVDSDRASWSYNTQSGNAGFGWVRGYATIAPQ